MSEIINILIAEDYKLIREGIKSLFEDDLDLKVVGEATTGKEALKLTSELKPDIILLDIGLPDMHGTKIIKELQNSSPDTKIIILTAHDSEAEIEKCISAGVYAYIIKDINTNMLVNIVKMVNKGAMWLDPKIVPKIRNNNICNYIKTPRKVFKNTHSNLTHREFEVLKLITEGKTNSDIANELCISEHTAKAHVCNIIQKLVVDDRTQAAVKALKEGIIQ